MSAPGPARRRRWRLSDIGDVLCCAALVAASGAGLVAVLGYLAAMPPLR